MTVPLTKDISSTNKLYADDTSIFSVVYDIDVSEHELNSDLMKIAMGLSMKDVLQSRCFKAGSKGDIL